MTLPVVKRIDEWEIDEILNREYDINQLLSRQPQLYKLIQIARKYEQEKVYYHYTQGAAIVYSLLLEAAKPNELPIVSQATVDSTLVSFFGSNHKEKGIESWNRIAITQENIFFCAVCVLNSNEYDEDEKDWMVKGMAQIYEFLYRQEEANDMKELFS